MKNKISITAEFASLIKSDLDPNNLYFVSKKTQMIGHILVWILPNKLVRNIYSWRLELSKIFNSILEKENPGQVIDLGAGYSLRGLNESRKNKDLVYIDSDFKDVILRKEQVLVSLCRKEGFEFPPNLHPLDIDVLKDNLSSKIKNQVLPAPKTLVIAEGLTSYFDIDEFKAFLENIKSLRAYLSDGIFYSHEKFEEPRGTLYKVIRKTLSIFTHTQRGHNFKSQREFMDFLKSCGINEFKIDYSSSAHLVYSFKI